MALPVRGQRTRTQVSCDALEFGMWAGTLADNNVADHDREEVQPRGQARLDGFLPAVSSSFCFSRLAYYQQSSVTAGRRTEWT